MANQKNSTPRNCKLHLDQWANGTRFNKWMMDNGVLGILDMDDGLVEWNGMGWEYGKLMEFSGDLSSLRN